MEGLIGRYKTILAVVVLLAIALYTESLVDAANNETRSSPTPTATLTPTNTPPPSSLQATLIPTNPQSQKSNLNDFFYPGATQLSLENDKLELESSDTPGKITDWYKEKFDSFGMRAKAFSQTSVNGNAVNKLVGDNGSIEIRIEITKKREQEKSKIVVEKERP